MSALLPKRALRDFLVGEQGRFVFDPCRSVRLPDVAATDLYIHIPFCRSLCPYCPYNRILYDPTLVAPYVEALHREIDKYHSLLGPIEVGSIYVGGGTPTTLIDEIPSVIEHIQSRFRHSGPLAVETTPEDLDNRSLKKLRSLGVNLLSIGVQSFDDHFLKLIGRRYRSSILPDAIARAHAAGFDAVNLDLMFALPGQTTDQALADLDKALELGAEQVTLYPLFTFPYSSIGRHRQLEHVGFPRFGTRRHMYKALHDRAVAQGLERISVWGFTRQDKPRFSSVTRDDYFGLGAGAGSCLPGLFYFNTFSVDEYIRRCAQGELPVALQMAMTPRMEQFYWLYWRLYETRISKARLQHHFADDAKVRWLLWLALRLHFMTDAGRDLVLTERGAFWIHLLQNHYVLDYIDKVWNRSMQEAWPARVRL